MAKNNSGAKEIIAPAQDVAIVSQDGQPTEQAETQTDTQTVPDITLESLTAIATEKQQAVASAMQTNPSDFDGNFKLMIDANKAMQAVKDFINACKQAELQEKLETERKEKVAKVDTLLSLHDELKAITATMPPYDEQTDEQKATVQDAYDASKAAYIEICDIVAGAKPKVIHLKEGASGEGAVNKGKTGQEIEDLYKAEIAAGKTDTDARKAVIAAGHARGTVGAVVLAYLKRTGNA